MFLIGDSPEFKSGRNRVDDMSSEEINQELKEGQQQRLEDLKDYLENLNLNLVGFFRDDSEELNSEMIAEWAQGLRARINVYQRDVEGMTHITGSESSTEVSHNLVEEANIVCDRLEECAEEVGKLKTIGPEIIDSLLPEIIELIEGRIEELKF